MASEYYKWKYKDVTPDAPPPPLGRKEKALNWLYYHMTSTPALGTLINTAGTEDVASAYAATYPIALIAVVLVSQLLVILF